MAVRASRLRKRVRLKMPVTTTTASGEHALSWTDAPRPVQFAEVIPMTAREQREARQVGEHTTHRVRLRYRADLTSRWRLELAYGGRVLEVDGVRNLGEMDTQLELTCVEVES